jgi:hypothetical protein
VGRDGRKLSVSDSEPWKRVTRSMDMLIDPERVGESRSLLPYCLHAIPMRDGEDEMVEERKVRRGSTRRGKWKEKAVEISVGNVSERSE